MGKASRLHRQAVIEGREAPIRHEKWKPTPRLHLAPKGMKGPRSLPIIRPVTAEKLAELKEGAPDVLGQSG